jgi:hypothetical protein
MAKDFSGLTEEIVLRTVYDTSRDKWGAGYTQDNLSKEFVVGMPMLSYVYVHRTHPVLPLLVAASGYPIEDIVIFAGYWYKVNENVFQTAVQRVIRECSEFQEPQCASEV